MASDPGVELAQLDGAGPDGPDVAEQKRRWRARARAERSSIEPDHVGFCRTLEGFLTEMVPPDRRVVTYQAMGSEVDLGGLILAHDDADQRFAVTRTPDDGLVLTVHPWGGPQERHRYGYDQPPAGSPQIADDEIGAVLVPALAFDVTGARLGRGKGYYDRLLARLPPSCLRVGITGDYVVERLPVGPFDVAMTHLAFSDRIVAVEPDPTGSAVT